MDRVASSVVDTLTAPKIIGRSIFEHEVGNGSVIVGEADDAGSIWGNPALEDSFSPRVQADPMDPSRLML